MADGNDSTSVDGNRRGFIASSTFLPVVHHHKRVDCLFPPFLGHGVIVTAVGKTVRWAVLILQRLFQELSEASKF